VSDFQVDMTIQFDGKFSNFVIFKIYKAWKYYHGRSYPMAILLFIILSAILK
jgi:hypothetical protein